MMNVPFVSNIQRFSVDDGPGIRTTVFFKGCNLRCFWCHNPECISEEFSIQLVANACVNCGTCFRKCPSGAHQFDLKTGEHSLNRSLCTGCGICEYYCPHGALKIIGKRYDPQDLLKEILKDKRYFDPSGGGVTFSGGEPMLHPDYLCEVLKLCKEAGLHTAVDTAGCVPFEYFEKIMPYTDLFLYDIKMWDTEKHMTATGVSNKLIIDNLIKLTSSGADVYIRTPVIMEWNGDLKEFDAISNFLAGLENGVKLIQLLPYHSYGVGKYNNLGLINHIRNHTPPSDEFMQQALQLYIKKGLPARIS